MMAPISLVIPVGYASFQHSFNGMEIPHGWLFPYDMAHSPKIIRTFFANSAKHGRPSGMAQPYQSNHL
jgi:hypothetical protein